MTLHQKTDQLFLGLGENQENQNASLEAWDLISYDYVKEVPHEIKKNTQNVFEPIKGEETASLGIFVAKCLIRKKNGHIVKSPIFDHLTEKEGHPTYSPFEGVSSTAEKKNYEISSVKPTGLAILGNTEENSFFHRELKSDHPDFMGSIRLSLGFFDGMNKSQIEDFKNDMERELTSVPDGLHEFTFWGLVSDLKTSEDKHGNSSVFINTKCFRMASKAVRYGRKANRNLPGFRKGAEIFNTLGSPKSALNKKAEEWTTSVEEAAKSAPEPAAPEPAATEPAAPEPAAPEPAAPEPAAPEPAAPEPAAPEPAAPEPNAPEPTAPEPKAPEPKAPEPTAPEPTAESTPESFTEKMALLEESMENENLQKKLRLFCNKLYKKAKAGKMSWKEAEQTLQEKYGEPEPASDADSEEISDDEIFEHLEEAQEVTDLISTSEGNNDGHAPDEDQIISNQEVTGLGDLLGLNNEEGGNNPKTE